jgi:hypothetical protein
VGTSRTAIWKKQFKGELTTFVFNPKEQLIPIFGKGRSWTRLYYEYMSLDEIDRWVEELEQRQQEMAQPKIQPKRKRPAKH